MKITALFAPIEKLITEHGSAVVQEKHIALLKEQFSILERENTKLNTRLEKSESENKGLKTENKNLKNEIIQLKKKIETHEKSTHNILLDDAQILILQCLSNLPRDTALPLEPMMLACNLSEQSTLYHLKELEDEFMIESEYINDVPHWFLDHDGRGYLIKHKLIS
jgi:hypothetical protein